MNSLGVRLPLSGFLVLTIFDVFPPGSPQPADALVLVLIGIFLNKGWIKFKNGERYLIFFTLYAYVVNSAWATLLDSFSLLVPPAYFTFNILAFAVFRRYFEYDKRNLQVALVSVLIALCIQALFTIARGGEGGRSTGTFDNPNALAYFGLCYASVALFLADALKSRPWVHALALVLGWTINLFALSKAGMGGMVFLTFIILVRLNPIYSISGLAVAGSIILFGLGDRVLAGLERMDAIGEDSDDSLAGRGYDRILNEFYYLILGAGEGDYRRHDSIWGGEIHSTFGTLLFCYGVVGFFLFCMFLYYVYRLNRINFLLYSLPVFVYSLTHNGLRATPFWLLLALLAANPSTTRARIGYKARVSAGRHANDQFVVPHRR